MHAYATDSNERQTIPLIIAAVSVASAWLLNRALFLTGIAVPWWVDSPSVMGFYGVWYSIFEKWLWRTTLSRKLGLVRVPDLNGTWKGTASSSYDDFSTPHQVTGRIQQHWSRVSVTLESAESKSESRTATIMTEASGETLLSYEYWNEPKAHATATLQPTRGTACLNVTKNHLEGQYYTGRGRQNYGNLSLDKASDNTAT
jgi:hypothetical protein